MLRPGGGGCKPFPCSAPIIHFIALSWLELELEFVLLGSPPGALARLILLGGQRPGGGQGGIAYKGLKVGALRGKDQPSSHPGARVPVALLLPPLFLLFLLFLLGVACLLAAALLLQEGTG